MPDKTISALDTAGTLSGSELVPIVQGGVTVKVPLSSLASYLLTETAIVPANIPFRGARVRLSADFFPGSTGFALVSFAIEDRDTDNIWNSGTPTRLVVPAGVTKVQLRSYVRSPSGPSGRYIFFKKNGAYFQGGAGGGSGNVSYDATLASSVVDVVPGDYFELEVYGSNAVIGAGLTSNAGLGTWFEMEIREYS